MDDYYFKIRVEPCDFHWNRAKFSDAKGNVPRAGIAGRGGLDVDQSSLIYEEAKEKGFMA
jgi:hypothetical protein